MTKDEAMEIIFSSSHYRELMDALEEAKKQLSPDEWQEVHSKYVGYASYAHTN